MHQRSITPREYEIAIKVMSHSKMVREYVLGILRTFGIEPESEEGKSFIERESRKYAEALVKPH